MRPSSPLSDLATSRSDHRASAQPSPFAANVVHVDGHAVLMVRGEVDTSTAERLSAGIDAALREAPRVVVDLRGVTFINSSGLRALIGAFRDSGQNPEVLSLRAPSPFVHRVLTITGIDQLMRIELDEQPPRDPALRDLSIAEDG